MWKVCNNDDNDGAEFNVEKKTFKKWWQYDSYGMPVPSKQDFFLFWLKILLKYFENIFFRCFYPDSILRLLTLLPIIFEAYPKKYFYQYSSE